MREISFRSLIDAIDPEAHKPQEVFVFSRGRTFKDSNSLYTTSYIPNNALELSTGVILIGGEHVTVSE